MIKIEFNPDKMELRIKGHANYDEMGKDIVCAAVSILYFTLADSLQKSVAMLKKDSLKVEEDHGVSIIKCDPLKKYEANIETIYWTCLNGLELIAENYKGYVELSILRG